MTKKQAEEMRKQLEEFEANENNNDNNNESEGNEEMSEQNTVVNPTKIIQISRKFVEQFHATATKEEQLWIESHIEAALKNAIREKGVEKGNKEYFAAFRAEFAKKFFPELVADKKYKPKESLLDTLRKNREKGGN